MSDINRNMQDDLSKRMATGSYSSVEKLIDCALEALDREDLIEGQLLEGVVAEPDTDLTAKQWGKIKQEGLDLLKGDSS